jgi:flagellar protein FliS
MNYTSAWHSYRKVATHTASPGQLVLMLFDGALRFLNRALSGFEKDDPVEFNETINNNLIRAQSIIFELNKCLDLERGGELAITLRRLYDYMDRRLSESNVKKVPDGIAETIQRLTVLRDAWQQMLLSQGTAPQPQPGMQPASLSACV